MDPQGFGGGREPAVKFFYDRLNVLGLKLLKRLLESAVQRNGREACI